MTFPEKIQTWITSNGKTFKAAAYELQINRRTLHYWMRGKHKPHPALQKVIEEKMDNGTTTNHEEKISTPN